MASILRAALVNRNGYVCVATSQGGPVSCKRAPERGALHPLATWSPPSHLVRLTGVPGWLTPLAFVVPLNRSCQCPLQNTAQ